MRFDQTVTDYAVDHIKDCNLLLASSQHLVYGCSYTQDLAIKSAFKKIELFQVMHQLLSTWDCSDQALLGTSCAIGRCCDVFATCLSRCVTDIITYAFSWSAYSMLQLLMSRLLLLGLHLHNQRYATDILCTHCCASEHVCKHS